MKVGLPFVRRGGDNEKSSVSSKRGACRQQAPLGLSAGNACFFSEQSSGALQLTMTGYLHGGACSIPEKRQKALPQK